jgi:hypothetical protein
MLLTIWSQSEGGKQCQCIIHYFLFAVDLTNYLLNFITDFSKGVNILFSVVISQWCLPVGKHWTANRSMDNCIMTQILSLNLVRIQILILSRILGSVTNNNGFWIGWLDLLALLVQSLITAHNQWLPKTRSIPSWTISVFSSIVPDLNRWRLSYECITCPFITPWKMKTEHSLEQFICCNLHIHRHGNVCQSHSNQTRCVGNVLTELCSAMDHSGFQAFWHTRHANVRQFRSNHVLPSRCPATDVYSS